MASQTVSNNFRFRNRWLSPNGYVGMEGMAATLRLYDPKTFGGKYSLIEDFTIDTKGYSISIIANGTTGVNFVNISSTGNTGAVTFNSKIYCNYGVNSEFYQFNNINSSVSPTGSIFMQGGALYFKNPNGVVAPIGAGGGGVGGITGSYNYSFSDVGLTTYTSPISVNDHFVFNDISLTLGDKITPQVGPYSIVNGANSIGRFLLTGNNNYELSCSIGKASFNNPGYVKWSFYDATNGIPLDPYAITTSPDYTSGYNNQNDLSIAYSPANDTLVEVRILAVSNCTEIIRSTFQAQVIQGVLPSLMLYGNNSNNNIQIRYNSDIVNHSLGSIVLNATHDSLIPNTKGVFINPIRTLDTSDVLNNNNGVLVYNEQTKEITNNPNKTFIIQHPVQQEKYLVHACLEGPEAGVYYRGKKEIVDREFIDVYLPSYVRNLAKEFTVNVSPICDFENDGIYPNLKTTEVTDGMFRVFTDVVPCKFNWVVYGRRQEVDVEVNKKSIIVEGDGPYKWITTKVL